MIEFRQVTAGYGGNTKAVITDMSFRVPVHGFLYLRGASGAGKTTILRMIAGLETADSGEILIDGKVVNDVPASERGIGFVFQNYALFRYMTVYENIAFGLDVKKWKKADIKRRVDELIELVGLKGFEKRYPNQLSGGQRQRIGIARALYHDPEILVFDEATSALDNETEAAVMEAVNSFHGKKTMVIIAHRLNTIEKCDLIYKVEDGALVPTTLPGKADEK